MMTFTRRIFAGEAGSPARSPAGSSTCRTREKLNGGNLGDSRFMKLGHCRRVLREVLQHRGLSRYAASAAACEGMGTPSI
eukprot:scaffold7428_cov248-Pinguiococcus_pyrenoidosus.AAC.4